MICLNLKTKKEAKTSFFIGGILQSYVYLQPLLQPQFESKIKSKIVPQSMQISPPFILSQPQPQFCKSKSKKMSVQQSNPQPQPSLPTSPQFEPPKKFICASYKNSYVRLLCA